MILHNLFQYVTFLRKMYWRLMQTEAIVEKEILYRVDINDFIVP